MSESGEDKKWGTGMFGWVGKIGNKIVGFNNFLLRPTKTLSYEIGKKMQTSFSFLEKITPSPTINYRKIFLLFFFPFLYFVFNLVSFISLSLYFILFFILGF